MSGPLERVELFLSSTTPTGSMRTTGALPRHLAQIGREPLLACTPADLRIPPPVAGLDLLILDAHADVALIRENLEINARGFDPAAAPMTLALADAFRATMGTAAACTARLHGEGAAAGMYLAPRDQVTELAGITTLPPVRGKGIAAALTAAMAAHAFGQGVTLAFLMTGNPVAQRVYERVGFTVIGAVTEGTQEAVRVDVQPPAA